MLTVPARLRSLVTVGQLAPPLAPERIVAPTLAGAALFDRLNAVGAPSYLIGTPAEGVIAALFAKDVPAQLAGAGRTVGVPIAPGRSGPGPELGYY